MIYCNDYCNDLSKSQFLSFSLVLSQGMSFSNNLIPSCLLSAEVRSFSPSHRCKRGLTSSWAVSFVTTQSFLLFARSFWFCLMDKPLLKGAFLLINMQEDTLVAQRLVCHSTRGCYQSFPDKRTLEFGGISQNQVPSLPWDREKEERIPCTGQKEKDGRGLLKGTKKKGGTLYKQLLNFFPEMQTNLQRRLRARLAVRWLS